MMSAPGGLPASVTIVGLGAMGGSLARALRALPSPPVVIGTSRDPGDVTRAEAAGVIDRAVHEGVRAVEEGEVVVYATPLRATLSLLEAHRERWAPGAVITDLCGVKRPLHEAARRLGIEDRYVGANAMAEGTGEGFAASADGLFDGVRVWVTPGGAPQEAVRRVEAIWAAIGARPLRTDPAAHDRAMAWCRHAPHLLANALSGALDVAGFTPGAMGTLGAGMIEAAGAPPERLAELLALGGGEETSAALRSVGRGLEALAALLEAGDVDGVVRFMGRTREWKEG